MVNRWKQVVTCKVCFTRNGWLKYQPYIYKTVGHETIHGKNNRDIFMPGNVRQTIQEQWLSQKSVTELCFSEKVSSNMSITIMAGFIPSLSTF